MGIIWLLLIGFLSYLNAEQTRLVPETGTIIPTGAETYNFNKYHIIPLSYYNKDNTDNNIPSIVENETKLIPYKDVKQDSTENKEKTDSTYKTVIKYIYKIRPNKIHNIKKSNIVITKSMDEGTETYNESAGDEHGNVTFINNTSPNSPKVSINVKETYNNVDGYGSNSISVFPLLHNLITQQGNNNASSDARTKDIFIHKYNLDCRGSINCDPKAIIYDQNQIAVNPWNQVDTKYLTKLQEILKKKNASVLSSSMAKLHEHQSKIKSINQYDLGIRPNMPYYPDNTNYIVKNRTFLKKADTVYHNKNDSAGIYNELQSLIDGNNNVQIKYTSYPSKEYNEFFKSIQRPIDKMLNTKKNNKSPSHAPNPQLDTILINMVTENNLSEINNKQTSEFNETENITGEIELNKIKHTSKDYISTDSTDKDSLSSTVTAKHDTMKNNTDKDTPIIKNIRVNELEEQEVITQMPENTISVTNPTLSPHSQAQHDYIRILIPLLINRSTLIDSLDSQVNISTPEIIVNGNNDRNNNEIKASKSEEYEESTQSHLLDSASTNAINDIRQLFFVLTGSPKKPNFELLRVNKILEDSVTETKSPLIENYRNIKEAMSPFQLQSTVLDYTNNAFETKYITQPKIIPELDTISKEISFKFNPVLKGILVVPDGNPPLALKTNVGPENKQYTSNNNWVDIDQPVINDSIFNKITTEVTKLAPKVTLQPLPKSYAFSGSFIDKNLGYDPNDLLGDSLEQSRDETVIRKYINIYKNVYFPDTNVINLKQLETLIDGTDLPRNMVNSQNNLRYFKKSGTARSVKKDLKSVRDSVKLISILFFKLIDVLKAHHLPEHVLFSIVRDIQRIFLRYLQSTTYNDCSLTCI